MLGFHLAPFVAKAKGPDSDAVIKKAIEENREEKELEMMGKADKRDHVVMIEPNAEVLADAPKEATPLAPTPHCRT